MPIDISFTLSEQDLDYFRQQLLVAQKRASDATESEIIERARQVLAGLDKKQIPDFLLERLDSLDATIRMLGDQQWPLEAQERTDIVSALAYLYEPEDTIADDVPTLGLLDDAIVVELVLRELRHELQAYSEFCVFRAAAEELGSDEVTRDQWLAEKRHELFERMRRRMERHRRTPQGVGRLTGFSLT